MGTPFLLENLKRDDFSPIVICPRRVLWAAGSKPTIRWDGSREKSSLWRESRAGVCTGLRQPWTAVRDARTEVIQAADGLKKLGHKIRTCFSLQFVGTECVHCVRGKKWRWKVWILLIPILAEVTLKRWVNLPVYYFVFCLSTLFYGAVALASGLQKGWWTSLDFHQKSERKTIPFVTSILEVETCQMLRPALCLGQENAGTYAHMHFSAISEHFPGLFSLYYQCAVPRREDQEPNT